MTKERLAELMDAAGVEQQELAGPMDLDQSTISRYVGGSRTIPDDFAEKAEAFLKKRAQERIKQIRLTAGVTDNARTA